MEEGMNSREEILKEARAALEQEIRINLHRFPIHMDFGDGTLTLEGEVETVAAKKLSLELAAAVPGVSGIVDRLRVAPAEPMEDGSIRDHLCDAFLQEPALKDYAVMALVKGVPETVREATRESSGAIEVEVADGVVILNGQVGSLSHKRLAGVLGWWVPGSRDVINGLEVVPFMEDNDDEVVDAIRLVLEKDPFVNASQIRVSSRHYTVTLEGMVPKAKEIEMAESDAWYVFRVDKVINKLRVAE
jgi:osmotically-inducible protein OsmY